MTREEAIKGLKRLSYEFSGYKPNEEMFDMAIKALEQEPCEDIAKDGTLTVRVADGRKVTRVLVCGDNHFGGLYYPDEDAEPQTGHCKDCKHFRKLPMHTSTIGKCIQHMGLCPKGDWYCADFEPQERCEE